MMMQLQRISQTCVKSSRSKMGLSRIAPTCLNMRRITPPRASPTFNTAPLIESAPIPSPLLHSELQKSPNCIRTFHSKMNFLLSDKLISL